MTSATLTASQIATLRNINERPGLKVFVVGIDYAVALQTAGYITIEGGRCYPTTAAAPFQGRSRNDLRSADEAARVALIGRSVALG